MHLAYEFSRLFGLKKYYKNMRYTFNISPTALRRFIWNQHLHTKKHPYFLRLFTKLMEFMKGLNSGL